MALHSRAALGRGDAKVAVTADSVDDLVLRDGRDDNGTGGEGGGHGEEGRGS